MRFFEYEARKIVELAGIPVNRYGFCTTPEEARAPSEEIGGPVVIKSQVLTGGRMKAGGVKFADTPDEAAEHAAAILKLEINGHMPRGVLVDPKAEVKQEYYASVVWDGTAKRPLMLFSDMGGIDIEEGARTHPDHVGRGHVSNLFPIPDFEAKQTIAATGVTGSQLNRATPILAKLARLFRENDMTLAEINPLAELTDGSFVALDAHMEMENEAVGRQKKLLRVELGIAEDDDREPYEHSKFEENVAAIDAADHRGVIQGKDHGFTGNLGLVIGAGGGSLTLTDAVRNQGGKPANYSEIGGNPSGAKGRGPAQGGARKRRRREDRGDDVDRLQHARRHRRPRRDQGLPRARQGSGRDDRDLPHPGRLGGRGLQDPRALRGRVLRPLGLTVGGRRPRRRQGAGNYRGGSGMSILLSKETTFIVQGITGREAVNLTRECLDYGSKVVGGVTPGRKGREVHGVPVFDTVAQAVEHHGGAIDGSGVTVPPAFTKDAVFEAILNGIKLIVVVTERIPRGDVAQMVELADRNRARLIGPNCLGLIVPEVCKMGGIGGPAKDAAKAYAPGPVGVMSRSGGMTTEISSSLTQAGLGVSTAVSIGGDAIIGSTYAELMPFFEADEQTKAIVIYTEPGGRMEAQLAAWVKENNSRLPIVAFMAGKFMDSEEMKGMSFGHAGTIVEGAGDTPTPKTARLEAAGIRVVERIDEIPTVVKEKLGVAA